MKEEHQGPHISIKAEPVVDLFGFHITNSLLTSFIVTLFFLAIALYYNSEMKKRKKGGLFYILHFVINLVYGLFQSVVGNKIEVFFPWLGAFFFYILLQNWFGLLPGVGSLLVKVNEAGEEHMVPLLRANTADLNTTIALGITSVVLIQYFGFRFLGAKDHIAKYFNFKGPMDFVMGLLEVISEFSRILSFSFRLYGNIFAGEVLIAIMVFILPIFLPFATLPFLGLEVFVGAIQALVFSMLTAVFLNMAVQKHH
jgi:F-type H+-transporting ATPase subunit a